MIEQRAGTRPGWFSSTWDSSDEQPLLWNPSLGWQNDSDLHHGLRLSLSNPTFSFSFTSVTQNSCNLNSVSVLASQVWASSRSWWWTGKPGVLQSMGSQRVGHDWATKLIEGALDVTIMAPGKCVELTPFWQGKRYHDGTFLPKRRRGKGHTHSCPTEQEREEKWRQEKTLTHQSCLPLPWGQHFYGERTMKTFRNGWRD